MLRDDTLVNRRDPRRTESLEKALDVVDAIGDAEDGISLAGLTRRLGKDKSTVWRILGTLVRRGYIDYDELAERYRLGVKLLELGARKVRRMDVVEIARPLVDELVSNCQETAQLAVIYERDVLYLYKQECYRSVAVRSQIGVRLPIHSTGSGKALLAHMSPAAREALLDGHEFRRFTEHTITDRNAFAQQLDAVIERGYAFDDEENEEGVRCIAAPIRNALGDPVAAVSIAAPAARISLRNADVLAREVVATAVKISARLGFVAPAATADGTGSRRPSSIAAGGSV